MSESQSSTARLKTFCERLIAEGFNNPNQMYHYIAAVFDIPIFSHEFMDLISAQRLTIEEVRSELHRSTIGASAKETFHGYLQTISDMIQGGLGSSTSLYAKRINQNLITGLDLMDERLSSVGMASFHPDLEDREDILLALENAKTALVESSLEPRVIAWALGEINRAEFLIRWSAHTSSHEALNILIGVIARIAIAHGQAKRKEKKAPILKVLAALALAAGTLSDANEIFENGGSLIGHMSAGIKAAQLQIASSAPKLITDQSADRNASG